MSGEKMDSARDPGGTSSLRAASGVLRVRKAVVILLTGYYVRILARTALRFDDYVDTEPSICRSHLDDSDHCLFQAATNGASTTSPPSRSKRLFFLIIQYSNGPD